MSDPHRDSHEPHHPADPPEAAADAPPPVLPPEPHSEPQPAPPPEPAAPAPLAAAPPTAPDRTLAIGLACALVLVLILVATAPFWAPSLPWGAASGDTEMKQRLDQVEAAQRQAGGAQQRLDKFEAGQQDLRQRLGGIDSAQQQLDKKLAQMAQQGPAAVSAAVQPLDRRLAALEAKPVIAPEEVAALHRQFDKLSGTTGDLAGRLDTLDSTVRASIAGDLSDMAAALALLQIREAVDVGRPFAAEYDLLAGFGRSRPDIAPVAAALAIPAKTGVATRAVLISRLRALAGSVVRTPAASAQHESWSDAALDKLSGLVTIRRVDANGNPIAASDADGRISMAETALAGGDLDKAVAAIASLTGTAADQAVPWLKMAHERLAVETALRDAQISLLARVGKTKPPSAPTAMPTVAPAVAPTAAPTTAPMGAPG